MSAPRLRARLADTREAPRRSADRIRSRLPLIAQTAIAAGLAWELASLFQEKPFFAPVAAVISLGVTRGQHLRRALELAFGVAVGILVATLLVSGLGSSGLAMVVVVGFAMVAALLLGAGVILVSQAAISGALIVALGTPPGVSSFDRFYAALVGCGVALLIGPVLFGFDPMRHVGRDADRVLARLAAALDAIAAAMRAGDADGAAVALDMARATDADIEVFDETLAAAEESIRLTPPRRRNLPRLAAYAGAAEQVDYAARNTRVLARTAQTATVRGVPADPALCDAIGQLARAVRALGEDLRGEPAEDSPARMLARQAAHEATAVLDRRADLAASAIVVQIRATAADLLRGAGMDTREMQAALGPFPGARDPA